MNHNMERLLRLVADYENFCSDAYAEESTNEDSDELSPEDLDFVAAAAALLTLPEQKT